MARKWSREETLASDPSLSTSTSMDTPRCCPLGRRHTRILRSPQTTVSCGAGARVDFESVAKRAPHGRRRSGQADVIDVETRLAFPNRHRPAADLSAGRRINQSGDVLRICTGVWLHAREADDHVQRIDNAQLDDVETEEPWLLEARLTPVALDQPARPESRLPVRVLAFCCDDTVSCRLWLELAQVHVAPHAVQLVVLCIASTVWAPSAAITPIFATSTAGRADQLLTEDILDGLDICRTQFKGETTVPQMQTNRTVTGAQLRQNAKASTNTIETPATTMKNTAGKALKSIVLIHTVRAFNSTLKLYI